MIQHEFIEVGNRRWCLGCDLFQQGAPFAKPPRGDCPRNTPYAVKNDKEKSPLRGLVYFHHVKEFGVGGVGVVAPLLYVFKELFTAICVAGFGLAGEV